MALFLMGLGLAVWARVHLGRNWGAPMSEKVDAELVTTGPYQYIRNPIYSGIMLAAIGDSGSRQLVFGLLGRLRWMGAYFVYSATVEGHTMERLFPDAYPAYKRSNKEADSFQILSSDPVEGVPNFRPNEWSQGRPVRGREWALREGVPDILHEWLSATNGVGPLRMPRSTRSTPKPSRLGCTPTTNGTGMTSSLSTASVGSLHGTARRLVGLVNVVWDGLTHVWIQDTMVANADRSRGIGTQMIEIVRTECQRAGCEWLHVDFDEELAKFYFQSCGFTPTSAGLIQLG